MIKGIVSYEESKLYKQDLKELKEWKSDFNSEDEIQTYYSGDFFNDADQIFFKDKENNKYYSIVVVIDKNNDEIVHRYWQLDLDCIPEDQEYLDALLRNKNNIIKAVNILLFWEEYNKINEIDIYWIVWTFPFNLDNLKKIEIAWTEWNRKTVTYKNFDIIVLYRGGEWYTYNFNAYNINN